MCIYRVAGCLCYTVAFPQLGCICCCHTVSLLLFCLLLLCLVTRGGRYVAAVVLLCRYCGLLFACCGNTHATVTLWCSLPLSCCRCCHAIGHRRASLLLSCYLASFTAWPAYPLPCQGAGCAASWAIYLPAICVLYSYLYNVHAYM